MWFLDKTLVLLYQYPLIITLFALLLTILAFIIRIKRTAIAEKSLSLANASFENQKAKFLISLDDSYRFNFKLFDKRKIILFKVNITNQSITQNTFNATLIIEYRNENKEVHEVILDHSPSLEKDLPQKELSTLLENISIEGKGMKNGWLVFEQPERLENVRKNKYKVIIRDVDDNEVCLELVLIKDIVHEI